MIKKQKTNLTPHLERNHLLIAKCFSGSVASASGPDESIQMCVYIYIYYIYNQYIHIKAVFKTVVTP